MGSVRGGNSTPIGGEEELAFGAQFKTKMRLDDKRPNLCRFVHNVSHSHRSSHSQRNRSHFPLIIYYCLSIFFLFNY